MQFPQLLEFRVKTEDFKEGVRHDCENCPIALALQRVFPNYVIEVGPPTVEVYKLDNTGSPDRFVEGTYASYQMSVRAVQIASKFDNFGLPAIMPEMLVNGATFRFRKESDV